MAENIQGKRRYLFSALLQFSILGGLLAWAMKSYALPTVGWRGLFALSLIPIVVLSLIRFRSLARPSNEPRSTGSFFRILYQSRGPFVACLLLAAFSIASGTVNLFVVKELPQSTFFTVLFWFNVAPGMLIGAALVRR